MSFDKFSDNYEKFIPVNPDRGIPLKEKSANKKQLTNIKEKLPDFKENKDSKLYKDSKIDKISIESDKPAESDNIEDLLSTFEVFASESGERSSKLIPTEANEQTTPAEESHSSPNVIQNPLSTSRIMRLQASMNIQKEDIKKYAKDELGIPDVGMMNFNFPEVRKLLAHYGVDEKDIPHHENLDLGGLCKEIEKLKPVGSYYHQNCAVVKKTVEAALSQVTNKDEIKFLNVIKSRLDESLDFAIKTKNIISASNHRNQQWNALTEDIMDKVDEHANNVKDREEKEIGVLIQAGWSAPEQFQKEGNMGHWIFIEVKKGENGKYQIIINNAGGGVDSFHAQRDNVKYIVTKVYEIDARNTALKILYNILSQESESRNPVDVKVTYDDFGMKQCQIFYSHFITSGCKEIHPGNLTPRFPQRIGNCGIRNLLEGIFYISQRLNVIGASNVIQNQRREMVKKFATEFGYDALKKAVDTLEKEPITPLIQEVPSVDSINEKYLDDTVNLNIRSIFPTVSKASFKKKFATASAINASEYENYLNTNIIVSELDKMLKEYFPNIESFLKKETSEQYHLFLNELTQELANRTSIKTANFIKLACKALGNHFKDLYKYNIELQLFML
jgi:hypothetical protein